MDPKYGRPNKHIRWFEIKPLGVLAEPGAIEGALKFSINT